MSITPPPVFDADRLGRIVAVAPELDQLAAEFAARARIPGFAHGVVAGGRLVHAGGVGLADVEAHLPAGERTLFRIASMTKSFVAVAILQLRDAALLALDDPVDRYVPAPASLAYPTGDSPRLTLRHLLTMNSGWPEDNPWGDRKLVLDDAAFSALLASGITFAAAPNTHYEYSNLGFMILGRVVKEIAGVPFQEYATQHILRPLGMLDTCWNVDKAKQSVAKGYEGIAGEFVENDLAWACSAGDAAAFGGLYSSMHDLAKWVMLFLSAWPPRDGDEGLILRRSSLREMQRCANPRMLTPKKKKVGAPFRHEVGGYAYGLFASYAEELGQIVGHSGGLPGFGSHMVWLPDHDVGVVTLANSTYAPAVPIAMQMLRHVVTNAHLAPRRVQPADALLAAQEHTVHLLHQWDDVLVDNLVAANFFLDKSREHWQTELAQLRDRHGELQIEGELNVTNPLRGGWKMRGERGWCNVWITLAPTVPPSVQYLHVESVFLPEKGMQTALDGLLAATATPTVRAVAKLFAPDSDRRAMLAHLRAVNLFYGACTLEEILGGDGVERTVAQLQSPEGALEVVIALNPLTGKVRFAEFRAPV